MKYIIKFCLVIVGILMLGMELMFGLDLDETSKFLAKDKANTLDIINYSKEKDAEEKAKKEEEENAKLAKAEARNDALKKQKKEELFKNEEQERLLRLEAEAELKKEKHQAEVALKKEEMRKQIAETERKKRARIQNVKIINLKQDKFKVQLSSAKEVFYMEDYAELGVAEDRASSQVDREQIVTSDMYIRGLTESAISTRRGTSFNIMVERDVYSFESERVLIPKGSKLVCTFEPLEKYGETALGVICKRLYFPNGRSLILEEPFVNDQMNRAGLIGDLDNRMWEKYGQTFVMSIISGLALMGADALPETSLGELGQYTALSVLDLSTEILDETIDLAPVLTIPAGSRVIVRVVNDINLNPKLDPLDNETKINTKVEKNDE